MSERVLFRRILIPISGTEEEEQIGDYIQRYSTDDTIVFLVFINDETQINQIARVLKKEPLEVKVDLEEKGWRALYFLEEKFQDLKIKSNIQMVSGHPSEIIKKLIRKLNIDLLLIMKKSNKGIVGRAEEKIMEEVIGHSDIPILLI
ncbi:MAG: universal stress protein [bacterium]|nr:universal stress protein [bacterium]